MRFIKLTVAYDGTEYVGWQWQDNGLSIQQCLESAWKAATGEFARMTASGRTDAGVHALAQVCSVQTRSALSTDTLRRALNAHLPRDIEVLQAEEAPAGFHAIRDALVKTYRYQVQAGRLLDVFARRYRWFVPYSLDLAAMQSAASGLCGRHDFASFQTAGSLRKSTVRTIHRIDVTGRHQPPFEYYDIEISADGFLYNMVRAIAGSLILVGRGKQPVTWLGEVLAARDRQQAGPTAPAKGLFLVRVEYGETWPADIPR